MPKVNVPDEIEYPLKIEDALLESKKYADPDSFYFMPNQDLEYLLNAYNTIKSIKPDAKDILFVGGTLYSAIIKGIEKNKVNVECIELDPRALLSQCYAVYCMKNNGTLNSTMNHLLLEKFIESETYLTSTTYTKERIENEFEFFKKFISGKLKDENARRVFENIFELTKSRDYYQRKLPKFDTNPAILFEIFEKGIKPAYPDAIYNNEFYSKSFTIGKKYDAVMSNNVFEHSAGGNFFSAAANVLKENGLCEITLVKGGHIDEINFEKVAIVENAGKAHMVYGIYKNLKCKNYMGAAVPLGKNVLILRKR